MSKKKKNVLIGQYDCLQGHGHGTSFSGYAGMLTALPTYVGFTYNSNQGHVNPDTEGNPYRNGSQELSYGKPRIGTETRPSNLTIKVWKRTT